MNEVSPETQARLDAMLESTPRKPANKLLVRLIKAGKSKWVFGSNCTNCAGLRGLLAGAVLFNLDRLITWLT